MVEVDGRKLGHFEQGWYELAHTCDVRIVFCMRVSNETAELVVIMMEGVVVMRMVVKMIAIMIEVTIVKISVKTFVPMIKEVIVIVIVMLMVNTNHQKCYCQHHCHRWHRLCRSCSYHNHQNHKQKHIVCGVNKQE